MSYVIHKAMIITTWDKEKLIQLSNTLLNCGVLCSSIMVSPVNEYHSIMVPPSGSKEGWGHQKLHDNKLKFIEDQISHFDYSDGSNPFEYTIVEYGHYIEEMKA